MEHFRMVFIFKDESFDCEDFIGTEDEAREMFSERWMTMHNGHPFAQDPVRMEMIRMQGEIDETTSVAQYEIQNGVAN
jgi:hypothetical protein